MKTIAGTAFFGLWLVCTTSAAVLYVDDSAVGANNGTSWTDAYLFLQDALMMAVTGDTIQVGQGTYRPDEFVLSDRPSLGRYETFTLKNGVTILGGYAGFGAADPDARDVGRYRTILSGDLEGNDTADMDPALMFYAASRQDNSVHVVVGTGTDSTAVLEGFRITGGNANVPGVDGEWVPTEYGGGLYNGPGHCTIRDCVFIGNSAQGGGAVYNRDGSRPSFVNCGFQRNAYVGMVNDAQSSPTLEGCGFRDHLRSGMANYDRSNPTLTDCEFLSNGSEYEFGGGICNGGGSCPVITACRFSNNFSGQRGGALYCADKSDAVVSDCRFSQNRGTWYGGAVFSELSSPVFQRCVFEDNESNSGGAIGIGNWSWYAGAVSEVTVGNCLFVANHAGQQGPVAGRGGAISTEIWQQNRLTVTNCTFAGNIAPTGQAIFCDSFMHNSASEVTVSNSILWDGGDEAASADKTVIHIRYSDIQGGFPGVSWNIGDDPLFVDAAGGDFHLQVKSPCVNAGDNTAVGIGVTDLDGQPRIHRKIVDIGAYEFSGPWRIFVDDSAVGANDGTSWNDAFLYLQDALAMAKAGQEIQVAQGVYRPDQSSYLDGLIPGDRKASFRLKGGVAVRGGYAGYGAANPDARDVRAYETILSGDLKGNDRGGWFDLSRQDNSFSVVTAVNPGSGMTLEGFTITAGYSNDSGGGMFCHTAVSVFVRDCLFRRNFAMWGGGLYDSWSTTSRAIDCVFTDNYSTQGGGVFLNGEGCMSLDHCLIVGNQAEWGGGIYLDEAYTSIVNCTVANNLARDQWGGMIDTPGTSHFWSCIFWGNTCSDGSVEWAQIGRKGDLTQFDSCDVQGWTGQFAGVGTIDAHPLFAKEGVWFERFVIGGGVEKVFDWNNSDYHLLSQGGRWNPVEKIWVKDSVTSPCIDAGDPAGPIGPEPFPNGGVVNMGFDGGTAQASKSWFGRDCQAIYAGDINGDCRVDLADFAILAGHWLEGD